MDPGEIAIRRWATRYRTRVEHRFETKTGAPAYGFLEAVLDDSRFVLVASAAEAGRIAQVPFGSSQASLVGVLVVNDPVYRDIVTYTRTASTTHRVGSRVALGGDALGVTTPKQSPSRASVPHALQGEARGGERIGGVLGGSSGVSSARASLGDPAQYTTGETGGTPRSHPQAPGHGVVDAAGDDVPNAGTPGGRVRTRDPGTIDPASSEAAPSSGGSGSRGEGAAEPWSCPRVVVGGGDALYAYCSHERNPQTGAPLRPLIPLPLHLDEEDFFSR